MKFCRIARWTEMTFKINRMIELIFCHLIGDYVLQVDFIAKSKGVNMYHMFVHCALYCVPFYFLFGISLKLLFVFATHVIIDLLKARYKKIDYKTDQTLHYITLLIVLLI